VVGNGLTPFQVKLNGWAFYNSGASAYNVTIYKMTDPVAGSGQPPTTPSASGTAIITIDIPAGTSKEFFVEQGIFFKYGIFAIAGNAAVTGGVFYQ
jgi:hypothetical protein